MSAINNAFVTSLEETLQQATQPDSRVIKAATNKLNNELYVSPEALPSMLYILQSNGSEQIRMLASVEGRKLVDKHWDALDVSTKQQIKENVVVIAFSEASKAIRHQIAHIISAIASAESEDGKPWSDLVQLLATASTDDNNVPGKETALFILVSLLNTGMPELAQGITSFIELFSKTIHDPSSLEVRVQSLFALSHAAEIADEFIDSQPQVGGLFKATIPAMVDVLKDVMAANDDENTKEVFNCFNDFLMLDAKMLGDDIIGLLQIMIEISANTQIDEEIRGYALKFLLSAVNFKKNKISSKKLGKDITLVALKIVSEPVDAETELEDDDDDNENEESTPSRLALRLIDVASTVLPLSQVVGTIFEQLPHMLESSNLFERRAGFLAVGYAVSGAPDFYSTKLDKILTGLVAGLKDAEILVRLAALRALAMLIIDLKDLISVHYETLLPLIIEIIDSASNVTIYKYGCISLDGLIEFMSIEGITKYLEPLMNKLFHMLQVTTENPKLRAIIVSAIGSTAYAAGTSFIPYFAKSVETLQPFIQDAGNVEGLSVDDIELRALTFENISTMARAVKSESFSQVASPLIDSAYVAITCDTSRLREAGYIFISNMAKVYGKEFAPYLHNIMPQIYSTLQQEEITFGGEDDEEEFDEANAEDLMDKVQVRTGITLEKEMAAIALSELAFGTKELFAPYVEESVRELSQQSADSYGMRETALASLWKVVDAMTSTVLEKKQYPKGIPQSSYVPEQISALIQKTRDLSIDSLASEYEFSMVCSVLETFSNLISKYGAIILINDGDLSSLEQLCNELISLLKGEHLCQSLDDDELEEDEDSSEMDSLIIDSALEVLVALSEALGADFNRVFEPFKPLVLTLVKSKDKNKKVSAVGAIADIAANVKESNPDTDEMLQLLLTCLQNDKSIEVRGNAAYGIGILIFNSANDYSSAYATIFNLLSKLLTKVQKQETSAAIDDEETHDAVNRAYANACGCVSRLALKQQASTPLNIVLPILFEHLPLQTAYEEYSPIYELIIKLYQNGNEEIVPYTPNVIELLSHVFDKEETTDKLESESTLGREENIDASRQFQAPGSKQHVVELLKFLESKFPGTVSQNAVLAKYL